MTVGELDGVFVSPAAMAEGAVPLVVPLVVLIISVVGLGTLRVVTPPPGR
jgi:hypothetical protein